MTGAAATAPRFTVVMNVYNGERSLDASVESLLAQTCGDWEAILWDDRSTDGSAARCAAWAARDPRIRAHVAPANAGLGASRNGAVAIARGDWVAFLDQDDLWTPDKLAAQAALIAGDAAGRLGLVYCRAERFDERGTIGPFDPWYGNGPLPEGDIFEALLARPSFVPASVGAFRRSVLERLCPVPDHIRFCTDYWLACMTARDHRAAAVQRTCVRYRVHPGSMTYVYSRQVHEEILRTVAAAAGPAQQGIVRRRRRVHESWIGLEEIRAGHRRTGIARILRRGSLPYLALRPAVVAARRVRERLRPGPA